MSIAYWIVAGPLALFHLYAGTPKTVRSRDQLRPMTAWVDHVSSPALRTLGTVEVLGATGLVLPPLTGTAPWPASAAALCFVLLRIGAIAVHLAGEDRRNALDVGLVVTAAVTTWAATGL
ncbi:DoxX family protein [Streptomyces sp. NPDC051740]|uniref:DoxX family protein n=1 Tax=Streptomyces sp. NPDC051740 TaxID=3365673 RepID=UPI0037B4AEA9